MKKFKILTVFVLFFALFFCCRNINLHADEFPTSYTFSMPVDIEKFPTRGFGFYEFVGSFYYPLYIEGSYIKEHSRFTSSEYDYTYEEYVSEYGYEPINSKTTYVLDNFAFIYKDDYNRISVGSNYMFGQETVDELIWFVDIFDIYGASFLGSNVRYLKLDFFDDILYPFMYDNGTFQLVLEPQNTTIAELFQTILDIPPNLIKSYFSFEILGNFAYTLVFGFISILMVVWAIKRLI